MREEQAAKAAELLGERIISSAAAMLGDMQSGEAVAVVLTAGLGAFVALVAASGGTREAAILLVNEVLPAICDDVFAPEG